MALETATATVRLSFLKPRDEDLSILFSSPSNFPPSSITQIRLFRLKPASGSGSVVVMAKKGGISGKLGMAVFEPFEEVKKELDFVPSQPQASLARHKYSHECEAAVNHQINVEYNVSYVYHAMYSYFDRDNVALKGFAKFFKESSEEEREHAEILMEYQNKRGGRVKLQSILFPNSEYDHAEKGDVLYAMELALSFEKLTNENLLNLKRVADKNHDVQLSNFIQSKFLAEQVKSINKVAEYVAQLRTVGKGHEKYPPGSYEKARLRFAHAETVVPFTCLLGLFLDGAEFEQIETERPLPLPPKPPERRNWRGSIVSPFAGNNMLVLYSCSDSSSKKHFVQVIHHEHPIPMPGCNNTDFCPLEIFKENMARPHL